MSIVEKAAERLRESKRDSPRHRNAVNGVPVSERQATDQSRDRSAPYAKASVRGDTENIVALDFAELRRAGLSPPESMDSQIAREYQRIKRPILASLAGDHAPSRIIHGNRLMVSSASSGEGKTFTSFNLALSLARERDHSVLLVDGDVVKPGITRVLGLRDRPGLIDLLSDERAASDDMILSTDIPGLSVLPAGKPVDQMTELLSSRRMAWLVAELCGDSSRIVVFDSSPLLATSESQALALSMGQILMVVKAGATERRAVDAALSLITGMSKPISLILNQSRKAHGDTYAGYYGMYYTDDESRG